MLVKKLLNSLTLLWYSSVFILIYAGWMTRDQRYIVAESGVGYWIGIIGGSMMLLLLIYPVRKRNPQWRFTGSIKFWFRLHMIFGVVGPLLIIFHSGFRLGSLNGTVAFFSMIIVALSGLVGRYLYRSIHHGLYGEKLRFEELYHNDQDWEKKLSERMKQYPELIEKLQNIEKKLDRRNSDNTRSLTFYLSMRWRLRGLRKAWKKVIVDPRERSSLIRRVWNLRSICNLGINEILFSFWHLLHFPLFILMVFSGITHVVVVHFY